MVDVGRGVTKDRRIYHIYISVAQCITVYVGLAQARPNYDSVYPLPVLHFVTTIVSYSAHPGVFFNMQC